MDDLPNDIIHLIFNNIKLITDKRLFSQACKTIYSITKQLMIDCENNFVVEFFDKINNYSVEKFTLELCHDKYFNLIPKSYLYPNNTIIVSALAAYGNVDLLQIAINNGCELVEYKQKGCTDKVVEYYITEILDTCALAAHNGHQNVMEFCLNNGCKLNWLTCLMAAKNGQLAVIKMLIENNCEIHEYVPRVVAFHGHCDILQCLIDAGCKIDCYTCNWAAKNGKINILKLLVENGCKIFKSTSQSAALYGQIDTLEWLQQNNCKFSANICIYATGHLNVLIWLKQNGYNLTSTLFSGVVRDGNLEILNWLFENGYEPDMDDILDDIINFPAHIHAIECLENHGYKCDRSLICARAARIETTHVLDWLVEHYGECDKNTICVNAAFNGSLNVLDWLTDNNYIWDINSINIIMNSNNTDSINYIQEILRRTQF